MRKYILPSDGKFYKANLHTHSNLSDAKLSPKELKDIYKSHGYSILALTDHDILIDHSDMNDDDFIMITSYEMYINEHGKPWPQTRTAHINLFAKDPHNITQVCYNPKDLFANAVKYADKVQHVGDYMEKDHTPEIINKIIDTANKNGFIVAYNHPSWSLEDYTDYSKYEGFFAMEICNHDCSVVGHTRYADIIYDDMLRLGKKLWAIATDDAHSFHPVGHPNCDMLGAWTMIKLEKFDYTSIIEALIKGNFYASTGPEIYDYYIEDGKVHITCSPVRNIRFVTDNRHTALFGGENGAPITSAEFEIGEYDKYIRVNIIAEDGTCAYTNPVFVDEI